MNTYKMPLFETLSRRTDPETSRQAAKKMVESGRHTEQQEKVLAFLRQHPGHTCKELGVLAMENFETKHLTQFVFARRLFELKDKSAVVRGTRNGERIWWAL